MFVIHINTEDKTKELIIVKNIKKLIDHIKNETIEFTGEENYKPKIMKFGDKFYFEKGFNKHHIWKVISKK